MKCSYLGACAGPITHTGWVNPKMKSLSVFFCAQHAVSFLEYWKTKSGWTWHLEPIAADPESEVWDG